MKSMNSIEIGLEVYKVIIQNSNYFNEPPNDVLERLLSINLTNKPVTPTIPVHSGMLFKNVLFKYGMKLRKQLKGKLYEATVYDGYIELDNKRFFSPANAARHAAGGGSVNAWVFWDYFDEKEKVWKPINSLRNHQ